MKSKASSKFWKSYSDLPDPIQKTAVKQYRLWLKDSAHPSLKFKKVQNYGAQRGLALILDMICRAFPGLHRIGIVGATPTEADLCAPNG